jgi:hypothetical protein
MIGPDPGAQDVAGDIELDLLLFSARTGARAALAAALDIPAGLADSGPAHAPRRTADPTADNRANPTQLNFAAKGTLS